MKNKGIFISILASIALVVVAIVIRFNNEPETKESSAQILVRKVLDKSLTQDSDNDGLKNWEESLYGTDPGNQDSDNDGTMDGEEVKQGRSPLIAGPNDKETIASTTEGFIEKKKMTQTDAFSISLFSEYLEAKNAGKEITPQMASEIAERLLDQNLSRDVQEFDPKLLKTTSESSISVLKDYGNRFGTILKTPPAVGVVHESTMFDKLVAGGFLDDSDKKSLDAILLRYQTMRDALVNMVIPFEVAETHAAFITGLDQIIEGVEGIADFEIDPVGSYSKLLSYTRGIDLLETVALDYKWFFRNRNIIFSSAEGGYNLTK